MATDLKSLKFPFFFSPQDIEDQLQYVNRCLL